METGLTEAEVGYIFGVGRQAISLHAVGLRLNRTRGARRQYSPLERLLIRLLAQPVPGYGIYVLAHKTGITPATIRKILGEEDADPGGKPQA